MLKKICFILLVYVHYSYGQLMRPDILRLIGGDDHDFQSHKKPKILIGGDDHDFQSHKEPELLGSGNHDYRSHGHDDKVLIGGGDHDYRSHGQVKKLIGGGDHDYRRHGFMPKKKLLGTGKHDYKAHGHSKKKLLGTGGHDYKAHGHSKKKLIGGGDHDYMNHGKLIGGGDHDYMNHGKLIGGGVHDYMNHGKLIGGGDHDYKNHEKVTWSGVLNFAMQHCKDKSLLKKIIKTPNVKTFVSFANKYNRSYKNCHEVSHRLKVFRRNLKIIEFHKSVENGTATYGINKFADWTRKEFRKLLGLRQDLRPASSLLTPAKKLESFEAPKEYDWRGKGVVTPVKDQGMCGSCWAFSVTGNVEGQWALKHNKLYSLSEQELVDCDKSDEGCNGGFMENAYEAIKKLGGLETEDDYPYDAEDEKCHFERNKTVVTVQGGQSLSEDEDELKEWLFKNGPISIGINANALQFYTGGVSHPFKYLCDPKDLDHGMLIVGYGVHTTKYLRRVQPYWIIKNSWGEDWGEKGYYRVYRGDGTCGVNTDATSAIVT